MLSTSSRAPMASANLKQAFQSARQMRLNTPTTTPQHSPRLGYGPPGHHLTLPQFHLYNGSALSGETITSSTTVTPHSTPTSDAHLVPYNLRRHLDVITPPLRASTPASTETSRLRGEYFGISFPEDDGSALESDYDERDITECLSASVKRISFNPVDIPTITIPEHAHASPAPKSQNLRAPPPIGIGLSARRRVSFSIPTITREKPNECHQHNSSTAAAVAANQSSKNLSGEDPAVKARQLHSVRDRLPTPYVSCDERKSYFD